MHIKKKCYCLSPHNSLVKWNESSKKEGRGNRREGFVLPKAFTGPIKSSFWRCLDGQVWGVVSIPLYFHPACLYRHALLISSCTYKNYMYQYLQLYYQSEVGPVCKVLCNLPCLAKGLKILVFTTLFVFCLCRPKSIRNGGLLRYYTMYSEFILTFRRNVLPRSSGCRFLVQLNAEMLTSNSRSHGLSKRFVPSSLSVAKIGHNPCSFPM